MTILSKEKKLKAAYALNLCTVSVSQIVDYADVNILEQEYNAILNNLNLQNMPKDQALLNILKQILDTVTFFRVQEGDKAIIEKRYQQKMKNAIWNAVPSFGIIAAGDPYSLAISLVASVGMGYMNYRKEKARMSLEKEEQEWQLQRSAIEQFNALRRELFDTAWRLADTYDFDDAYRLTENQISQYNAILMDGNVLRRFERLHNIKNSFEAYPPFWYYLANSAKEVADVYKQEGGEDSLYAVSKYMCEAEGYYYKYLSCDMDLLRENQTRAACDLELASLLLERQSVDKLQVVKLVDDALSHCGSKLDVMQMCSMFYMRLHEIGKAELLLRKLVVEQYNEKTNAQLLSMIYLQEAASTPTQELFVSYSRKYRELGNYVDSQMLIPWVKSVKCLNSEELKECHNDFMQSQILRIDSAVEAVTYKLLEKQTIHFNEALWPSMYLSEASEALLMDKDESIERRRKILRKLSIDSGSWNLYVSELGCEGLLVTYDSNVEAYLDVLNKMCHKVFDIDIEHLTSTVSCL